MPLSIGQNVLVKNEPGKVKFIGPTQFAPGIWIGVELDNSIGKNNGSVNNVKYFDCDKKDGNYGVFVRESLITLPSSLSITKDKVSTESDLHKLIDKLQFKLKATTESIKEYKQRIHILEEESSTYQSKCSSLESQLELITVDKEFFEESYQKIQSQLEELQLRYDELKTDFQIMQEELELNKQIEDEIISQVGESNISETDVQTILSRNKQLELALINLQKLTDGNQLSLNKEIDELKLKLGHSEVDLLEYSKVVKKLSEAEATIESLQTQLDSALESEKIIEHLSSENENLNLQITKLTKTVEELTELHEIDKSLEENQTLVEADLKKDIRNLQDIITNDKAFISELQKKNKYMEAKVLEFKNKSMNFQPSDEGSDSLRSQMESLKLELKRYQSNNFSDAVSLKVAESQLSLLNQLDIIQKTFEPTYRYALDIIFLIKKNVAKSTTILDTIVLLPIENIVCPKSTLNKLCFYVRSLLAFLKALATLWEYNYDNELYTSTTRILFQKLSDLDLNLSSIVSCIKEGSIDDKCVSYISQFFKETIELLNIEFSQDHLGIRYQNIELVQILFESIFHEATGSINLLNILREFLDNFIKKGANVPESLISLKLRLDQLFQIAVDIEMKSKNQLELISKSKRNRDFQVQKSETFTFKSSFSCFGIAVGILSEITKRIEHQHYYIQEQSADIDINLVEEVFDFDSTSSTSGSLDSLMAWLEVSQINLDAQFLEIEASSSSIYETLKNNKVADDFLISKSSESSKEDFELLKSKLADISAKSLEKDRMIHDLQLNVHLLESNMASADAKNKEHINAMKQELEVLRHEHEETKTKYAIILENNQSLEAEIRNLLKSSQLFENGDLLGKFDSLQSEKQFTENMALVEEIILLRRMVNFNYNTHNKSAISEYEWLKQPLPIGNKAHLCPSSVQFAKCATKLRELCNNAKAIKVPGRNKSWKPKADIPKYITTVLIEQIQEYQRERNSILPSSLN